MRNFFISYNKADRAWAEWLAWELEEAGYTTVLQAWDFRPSENFVLKMNKAIRESERIVAVLSPDYLQAIFTQPEWASAFAQDPTNEKGVLVPVRIRECELDGIFNQIIYIDLVGKVEEDARKTLLDGIQSRRVKPPTKPDYPGAIPRSVPEQPEFPGTSSTIRIKKVLSSSFVKNLMIILALGFGVLLVVLFLYFLYFYNPVAERLPTLVVDPTRTTIINSKQFPSPSLKVTRGDNVPIKSDVTALKIYFWNDGKRSIKSENITLPLTLVLNDANSEIIDYNILKVSRPDIVKINLTPSNKTPTRELLLDFNLLEEDDGFSCQILYAGNPSAQLVISGSIEGVESIKSNETVSGGQFWGELFGLMPINLAVIVGIILVWFFAVEAAKRRDSLVDKVYKAQVSSRSKLMKYAARALPYMLLGMFIAVMAFYLFIFLPKEYARTNVVKAVPSSIRP